MSTLSSQEQSFLLGFQSVNPSNIRALTAWIAAESGWVNKPGNNYLNVMSGNVSSNNPYTAGVNTAKWMLQQSNFKNLAIALWTPNGQTAINAIIASPWDISHYSNGALQAIYNQLSNSLNRTPTSSPGQAPGENGQPLNNPSILTQFQQDQAAGLKQEAKAATSTASALGSISGFLGQIVNGNFIKKVAMVIGGFLLIATAIIMIVTSGSFGKSLSKAATLGML